MLVRDRDLSCGSGLGAAIFATRRNFGTLTSRSHSPPRFPITPPCGTLKRFMRILVVGSGGREHALAWKLKQSPAVEQIFCAPGNPGTAQLGENVSISATDLTALARFDQN